MRTSVGIELTPAASRIVEVVDRRQARTGGGESVVRSFAVCRGAPADLGNALTSFRGKTAAVVVWNAGSEHRQVNVRIGSYEYMRGEALRALAREGLSPHGVWADIAPAGPPDGAFMRVVVSIAPARRMAVAVQPLIDAGVRVRTVMTPAAALAALARSRRTYSVPDTTEAYVALEDTATCVALIRNGALMAARQLPWGFLDDCDPNRVVRQRDDIVVRLGDDLEDLFALYGGEGRVTQVCVCGGLPELRTTTLPLIERLDVEVDSLDSLSGIDTHHLLQPTEEFRDRASELRLAWVAAANWTTINLLRSARRRTSCARLSRAAVVAGIASGLGSGWGIAQTGAFALAPLRPPSIMREPPALMREPVTATDVLPRERRTEATVVRTPPPIRRETARAAPRPARSSRFRRTNVASSAAHSIHRVPPFDAVLSSILFSPDRQLAIIDGRVLGRGDTVRDATIVDISASVVLLRDADGRLRRLSTGGAGR